MAFTAEEIETKEFLVGLRGYDKAEVDAFLRAVAVDFRDLERKAKAASDGASAPATTPVEAPPATTDEFVNIGEEVAAVLRAAKEAGSGITAAARAEAAKITAAAEREAQRIVAGANQAAEETLEGANRTREDMEARAAASLQRAKGLSNQLLERSRARLASVKLLEQATRLRIEETETALRGMREQLESSQGSIDEVAAEIQREQEAGAATELPAEPSSDGPKGDPDAAAVTGGPKGPGQPAGTEGSELPKAAATAGAVSAPGAGGGKAPAGADKAGGPEGAAKGSDRKPAGPEAGGSQQPAGSPTRS